MAKNNKTPLTPEQIAEKKLNGRKKWARFFAVVLALVITAGVYLAGSKGGHKIERVEPQAVVVDNVVEKVVTQPVTVTVTVPAPATEAPATEAPAATEAPTTAAPPADSGSDGGSDILGSITDMLGGLTDNLSGGIDMSGAADTIEGIGSSAKDFFYNIADKVSTTEPAGSAE